LTADKVRSQIFVFRGLVENQLVPIPTGLPQAAVQTPEHLRNAFKSADNNTTFVTAQTLFTVKPAFRVVLNKVLGVSKRQTVFTYAEVPYKIYCVWIHNNFVSIPTTANKASLIIHYHKFGAFLRRTKHSRCYLQGRCFIYSLSGRRLPQVASDVREK
jgi:hypothetical protein